MTTNATNNRPYPELQPGAIDGVVFRELKTVGDNRGFFREVLRRDNPQIDAELDSALPHILQAGVVLEWTVDFERTHWWYVPVGTLQIRLCDNRAESATFGYIMEFKLDELDAAQVVKIPTGIAFTCRAEKVTQLVEFAARIATNSQPQLLAAEHAAQQFRLS